MLRSLRLDKLLSDAGWGSRAEVRKSIAQGRVAVDGKVCRQADRKVLPDIPVSIDGNDADYRLFDYLMMHKPEGFVSATEDAALPTVVTLLSPRYQRRGLFPVGRLDRDATGLLLLTNDGAWAHAVTSPRRHVDKVYEARVVGALDESDIRAFAAGLVLKSGDTFAPALLENLFPEDGASSPRGQTPSREEPALTLGETPKRRRVAPTRQQPGAALTLAEHPPVSTVATTLARITLREGKYHQVKRMLAARGHPAQSLKRISIGPITLDDALKPGDWRFLTPEEISGFTS